jgi:aryl-alcohol dehydrogenase (NADP+)
VPSGFIPNRELSFLIEVVTSSPGYRLTTKLPEEKQPVDYVNLGRSGLKVSRICLGTLSFGNPAWRDWVLPEAESRPLIKRALELGVNFFDTADMYSQGICEEVLGRALGDFVQREEVVIATKVYFRMGSGPNQRGLSRKHILDAIDASLQRLDTDYVDLYQIHRWDCETPIEETLETLHDLVRAGKVRYLGASSMNAWQFARALYLADQHRWTRFITMQNHYNLVYREEEREMLPLCRAEGIGVIPYSPLARGFLVGNRHRTGLADTRRARQDEVAHHRYYRETDFDVVDRVIDLAERKRVSPAQIALAWLLHQPGITAPIIGATRASHIEEGVAALTLSLSREECTYLEEPYQPHPAFGRE